MRIRTFTAWSAVLLTASFVGCSGNSQSRMAANQPFYGNGTQQLVNAGQHPAQQRGMYGTITNALTNNPVNRSVQNAVSGMMPSGPQVSKADPLLLSNQRDTPTPSLLVSMGKLAEQYGNKAQARSHYQKALQIGPTNVEALLAFGHLEDREGHLDEALKLYDQAVRSNPNNAAAHNDLGLCLARKGDMSAGVASLAQSVQLMPHRKLYRNNLATVLVELNRTDEALGQLTAVNPPAVAHYNLGYLLNRREKTAEAKQHFAQALQLDPNMKAAQNWLAKLSGGNANVQLAQQDKATPVVKVTAAPPVQSVAQPQAGPYAQMANQVANRTVNTNAVLPGRTMQAPAPQPHMPVANVPVANVPVANVPVSNVPVSNLPVANVQQAAVYRAAPAPAVAPQQPVNQQTQNPPLPQFAPNYPVPQQQSAPMQGRYQQAPQGNTGQPASGIDQSQWPLQLPSQVPNTDLGRYSAQPPLPVVVNHVHTFPAPQPLPPVRQATRPNTAPRY